MSIPMITDDGISWRLVMRCLPWDLVLVRLGGSALQLVAERSSASTWVLTGLLSNMGPHVHPAWCLVALMAVTALVSELDTTAVSWRNVDIMTRLAERFQMNQLYFALPVAMQSRCVLLLPYTNTPLIFLHLYGNVRGAELLWLGLLLKVFICVAFVIAANTVLFV
ncbi:solute carrier family 13 member 4-like [Amblyomma americanum]